MTWTSHTYSSGEVLASSKMTTLQANFKAMADADSGSPTILSASLISSVRQSSLKTATSTATITTTSYALTGGTYSWYSLSAGTPSGSLVIWSANDTASGVLGIYATPSVPVYIDERYVQASPPYNLGNGDIPLFVFASLDNGGAFTNVSIAPDPPWAYHGPTNICQERTDQTTGRQYRHYLVDGKMVEKEITQEIKNADMPMFPHPFTSIKDNVILFDPFSKLIERIRIMMLSGGESEVRRMITNRHFIIGDEIAGLKAPPGVVPVHVRLK